MPDPLVDTWRRIIVGADKSWVLFEHGTCVILMQPASDLAAQATALLQEWGPAHAGTPSADFSVIKLDEDPGWVVTSPHPDILTYVGPDEFDEAEPAEVLIGLIGRAAREQDAAALNVIHVEDKRLT